jgi:hypothetical protein
LLPADEDRVTENLKETVKWNFRRRNVSRSVSRAEIKALRLFRSALALRLLLGAVLLGAGPALLARESTPGKARQKNGRSEERPSSGRKRPGRAAAT